MNYGHPYAPDPNPPPGIPQGYPYGQMPSVNPMYPPLQSGYLSQNDPMSYPSNPSVPYPYSNPSPYPTTNPSLYPMGNPSPYPTSNPSPYPTSNPSPYPTSNPSPYPTGNPSPYPMGNPSYPMSNPSPYPMSNVTPYPMSNPSPYPTSSPGFGYSPSVPTTYPSQVYPGAHQYQNKTASQRNTTANMAQYVEGQGTVVPYPNFDPKQDAEELRKAMKGFGTDEKAIINVLANRSNAQRVYVGIAFKQLFGKDLISDLKSELSGNFEDVIIGLMTPLNDYLANELHKALSGLGTDEDVLVEILCTRKNQEVWAISEAYRRLYGKSLEDDITSDTSGHFERLLVSACTAARSEAPADPMKAQQDAQALYQAGVGQWGTNESVFNAILAAESFHQLSSTFYEYHQLTGHTVAEAIEKEMSGDVKRGMLAIARSVENRPMYFAEKLYKAMKGLGTDDKTLIRIVVSRCEIDMVQIKAEYERTYGKSLAHTISGDTSGDYRKVLVALVGE